MDSDEDSNTAVLASPREIIASSSDDMTIVAENIAAENEKIGYDPEIGTNWRKLPTEMRLECIKRMDFPDQFQMRNTSHAERELIDSQKLCFIEVYLHFGHEFRATFLKSFWVSDEEIVFAASNNSPKYRKAVRNAAQLMKMATVNTIEVEAYHRFYRPLEEFVKLAPYRFNTLKYEGHTHKDWRLDLFFMNNCSTDLHFRTGHFPQFADFMSVKIPLSFEFETQSVPRDVVQYIEKWIDDDVEVGTKLSCITGSFDNLAFLTRALRDRKISYQNKLFRYRTNNDAKELHLTLGRDEIFDRVTLNVEMKAVEPSEPPEPGENQA